MFDSEVFMEYMNEFLAYKYTPYIVIVAVIVIILYTCLRAGVNIKKLILAEVDHLWESQLKGYPEKTSDEVLDIVVTKTIHRIIERLKDPEFTFKYKKIFIAILEGDRIRKSVAKFIKNEYLRLREE